MDESPRVSVILPTYNGDQFVADAIDSVLEQTFSDFELLVVDDGSTDSTVAVARVYEDDRVTVHENEENRGVGGNMNHAVGLASGDILAFLDQDDTWTEQKLERHIERHIEPDIGVVYSNVDVLSADGNHLERVRPPEPKPAGEPLVQQLYTHLNFIRTFSSVTIAREAWEVVGGLDTSLTVSADFDLYLRLAASYGFAHVDDALAIKRRHSENVSGDFQALYDDIQTIANRVENRYPESTDLEGQEKSTHYFQRAFYAYRAGESKDALHDCLMSVKSKPRPDALFLLSILSLDALTDPFHVGTVGYRAYRRIKEFVRRTLA